jgi:nucleolar complex protein 3
MSRPPKRRRLTPPPSDEAGSHTQNGHRHDSEEHAAGWDVEQEYEKRAKKPQKKESSRLLIKTAEGWKKQEVPEEVQEEQSDSFLGSDDEGEQEADKLEGEEEEEQPKLSHKQQVIQAKEELARLAGLINEDPEENIGALRKLGDLGKSSNTTVQKLAIATQCAVYRDIIPGYRIRSHGELDPKARITKEVRKLQAFEGALLSGYQAYVRELQRLAKGSDYAETAGLATVVISCASELLLGAMHFNFRADLIGLLVNRVARRPGNDNYNKCIQTLEELFRNDAEGRASLDAVSALTKMIKGKNYRVHESVLNTFLQLRLLSEFAFKASRDRIDKERESFQGKKRKQVRPFQTKRDKKLAKERKVVEKEMKEADAAVGQEERDRMQAEMLKLVFATYFRILKAKTPGLMGAVLEGLAKYAHLINQDFFGDILEALKELIIAAEIRDEADEEDTDDESSNQSPRNVTRESLLCVITAFALLQGQDVTKSASALHLDLNFFITHLYRTLYPAVLNVDIELSSKSLHLADPNGEESAFSRAKTRVNVETTTVLLIRSLTSVLLPEYALRAVPPLRIAAFTKQLLTASLQLPEKSCLAMLSLLEQVVKIHSKKIAALWNTEERKGDGVFDPLRVEVESSNPFAATVWEGEILRHHYCPKVRESVKSMEKALAGV